MVTLLHLLLLVYILLVEPKIIPTDYRGIAVCLDAYHHPTSLVQVASGVDGCPTTANIEFGIKALVAGLRVLDNESQDPIVSAG